MYISHTQNLLGWNKGSATPKNAGRDFKSFNLFKTSNWGKISDFKIIVYFIMHMYLNIWRCIKDLL